MRIKLLFSLIFTSVLIIFTGCQNSQPTPTPTATPTMAPEPTEYPYADLDAATFAANERLGRGINLGNSLEGPREGAWGLYLQSSYFEDIAAAGFDSVRIPIRWSTYADIEAPYTIDTQILERVDWAIEQAYANDLNVIINVHHFEAIMQQPETQTERLAAIWTQISERYQDYPDTLYFEILNEPNENLNADLWNEIFPPSLAAIRETNPERYVIIGPDSWNNVDRLPTLTLPEDDRHIIGTFHFYSPHKFTHQNAPFNESGLENKDLTWGTDEEVAALIDDFDTALAWSENEKRPLFIGEFGVFYDAPEESRILWLATVREEAEKRGYSWSVWDFGTDFAIYNLPRKQWREPFLEALIPES